MHILLTGNTSFKIANFRAGLIRALQDDGHRITVLAPVDGYSDGLTRMGCRFLPLTMDRNGTSPAAESRLLATMHRTLRRERPDFVFGFTIKNNIYAGLACRRLAIPFVPNVTGLGPAFNADRLLNRLVRRLYRAAFADARAVFFQNADDRAVFLDTGLVDPARTWLLPGSGVDLSRFAAAPYPPQESGLRFLFMARLLWDKGVGQFVEVARRLKRSHPQTTLQIAGPFDPDSKSAVPQPALQQWRSEGLVDYLGERRDVRPLLAQCHCLVLPTYYREGTPRTLLEAAASARPVITSDRPGCRDTVLPGISGLLCRPRDADDLHAKMLEFLDMPPLARSRMGAEGRRHVTTHFDENKVIAAYLEVLSGHAQPAPDVRAQPAHKLSGS